jgi:hypothetical protein
MMMTLDSNSLSGNLGTPVMVTAWRRRALWLGAASLLFAVCLAWADRSLDHLLRAWLLGLMLTLSFAVGGLALLMLHYLTGGKWGFVLRRPLEAMSRTLPLVFGYWVVIALGMKRIYLWARVNDAGEALRTGILNAAQAHAIAFKRPMLNPLAFVVAGLCCFAVWGFYTCRISALGKMWESECEKTPEQWKRRLENLSGHGLLLYGITMTAAVIFWVMSLDAAWYSSVFGLLFLVGQACAAMAMATLLVLSLAADEPMRSLLRKSEQSDLGTLCFAFVMLNAYLAFSQFLIVWSGNLPAEIPWYLDRTRGHWNVVLLVDVLLAWLLPFVLLLSRDLKRNRTRLARVCQLMILARAVDLFWTIEPSFGDAAGNLHFTWGILEYVAMSTAMTAFWTAYLCAQLQARSLIQRNDPLLAEILENNDASA